MQLLAYPLGLEMALLDRGVERHEVPTRDHCRQIGTSNRKASMDPRIESTEA